jgi:Lipopolysaccharide kinase (Kdo/WaaP) family
MTIAPRNWSGSVTPRTAVGRLIFGSSRYVSVPEFAEFAPHDWTETVMDETSPVTLHAKQGRTISLWSLATSEGKSLRVYLKRHYALPRWYGWLASVFPRQSWTPGLSEWDHLRWAEECNLPVARPIAAGEIRRPWGKLQSFLMVEELANQLPLHEAIPLAFRSLSADDFALWKRRLVKELARLARELHRRSTFHKDLYLCHFYLPTADCSRLPETFLQRVKMIDFHRLSQHRLGKLYFQVKDLSQLLFSTNDVPGITHRDRVRFWKLYREGDWHDANPPPNWIRRAIMGKWKRYSRHNQKQAEQRPSSGVRTT